MPMTRLRTMRLSAGANPALICFLGGPRASPGDEPAHPDRPPGSVAGLLGHVVEAQLQLAFMVYTAVCSRCHGIQRLAFRNLAQPGGPGFPEAAVKSLAATYEVDDAPDEQGKVKKRRAV